MQKFGKHAKAWQLDWPYDWTITETRLDPNDIAQQGSLMLSRALNLGRTIGFLGTGTSIPYGRVSWSELATVQIRRILKEFPTPDDHLRPLVDQLSASRDLGSGSADQNMMVLQLCEQFWSTLHAEELSKLAKVFGVEGEQVELSVRFQQPELGRRLMRSWVKRETIDELTHVRELLSQIAPSLLADSKTKLSRLSYSTAERDQALATYSYFFEKANVLLALQQLLLVEPPETTELLEGLVSAFDRAAGGYVAPQHYYLAAAIYELAAESGFYLEKATERRSTPSRRDLIPPRRDPLMLLHSRLGIARYLTTNYDLEIERFFGDQGFTPPAVSLGLDRKSEREERVNNLGDRIRDIAIDETNAADLIDFAVNEGDYAAQVVHLHGRSTADSELVITERDYQIKYLGDSTHQKVMREGLDIALGGNPILFVGLGLSEGDVLRPVREFMAGRSRRNHSLFALRPAASSRLERDQLTMQQYSRNGVHVIHYGFVASAPKGVLAERDTAWMTWFFGSDDSILTGIRFARNDDESSDVFQARFNTALNTAIKRSKKLMRRMPSAAEMAGGTFLSDGQPCDISIDIAGLCYFVEAARFRNGRARFEPQKLRVLLERLKSSLMTSALCAKLEAIETDWRNWRTTWRREPLDRGSVIAYTNLRPVGAPVLHARHLQSRPPSIKADFPPAIEDLLSALESRLHEAPSARRIFVVAGGRGSGKGTCFAALVEKLRSNVPQGRPAFFINLGFTSEIASLWDALAQFLRTGAIAAGSPLTERYAALREAMVAVTGRPLVVINAFDLLFDQHGEPKTSEIRQILEILFGDFSTNASVDWILFVKPHPVPALFRIPQTSLEVEWAVNWSNQPLVVSQQPIPRQPSLKDWHHGESESNQLFFLPPGNLPAVIATNVGQCSRYYSELVLQAWEATEQDKRAALLENVAHWSRGLAGAGGRVSGQGLIEAVLDHWRGTDKGNEAELTEQVLRHIAVIAMPVETSVLADCPMIHQHLRSSSTDAAQRLGKLSEFLQKLANRGLLFMVDRSAESPTTGKDDLASARWGIHRSLQLFVYRKLGGQLREPADSYLYAPSLYAAQGSGQVQLNARSYAFIYELVSALIGYPGRGQLPIKPGRQLSELDHPSIEQLCRRLRAAIGVVRSLFSVGVVSRFDDLDGLDLPLPPRVGYFEYHRMVIRWMIRVAGSLFGHLSDVEPERKGGPVPPFYRDELVWLYNECGIFSLAQGSIYDAQALFAMAMQINARIEGREGGPIQRRLLLNVALCMIDSGRAAEAEGIFRQIHECTSEHPLLRAIALGHMATAAHVRGRLERAKQRYDKAIAELEKMGRYRPWCLFVRHRGDLKRHFGDFAGAEADYEAAARTAVAGGNIDLVHATELSMVRLRLRRERLTRDDRKLLDQAIAYADAMDLPRLKSECLFAHGEILLASGETTLAAQEVTRALRIATLNGLAMRKASCMELLARIYRARGDHASADTLVSKAIKAARGFNYTLLIDRAKHPPDQDGARSAPATRT